MKLISIKVTEIINVKRTKCLLNVKMAQDEATLYLLNALEPSPILSELPPRNTGKHLHEKIHEKVKTFLFDSQIRQIILILKKYSHL